MKKVLFFLLAIIFAIQGYGQTVQTSFGTTTQSYIPIYTFYGYNYSQQIVTNAELVAGGLGTTYGQIVKIRWHWNGSGLFTNCVDWKIYIGHTTKTSFSSSTDWEPLTSLTLVYDSLLTIPTAAGWVEFILQTPFTYNGTDNLIIAVDENTPSYSSTAYFTSQLATSRGIYYYSDGTNPDPAAPPSGTVVSTVPNIQLYFMESCPGPGNLTSSAVTHENATVSWTPNGTETLWNLEYKISTDQTWTPITGLTTPTYTFNSLLPSTTYNVRVQANCGADQSAFIMPISFTTLASAPTTLPYTSDFENPTENLNWGFINGTQTNQWFIGDASYNTDVNNTVGGLNALYITNDAGLSWAYTLATSSTPSRVYAYRDFIVPVGTNELKLTIDWKANGNGYGDFLRVYWVPTDAVITAGSIPPGGLDISAALGTFYNNQNNNIHLQQATTWQTNEFVINTTQFPTLAGNTWRLLIHWRNENTSAALQPPATVDNISLIAVTCASPTQLVASNPTINSIDLTWTENGSATTWNVEYKKSTETTWMTVVANSNPFTVTGLDPSSIYNFRVQSDCSAELSLFTNTTSFATACAAITTLPWIEGFEGITANNQLPPCWSATSLGSYTFTQIANYGSYNRNARTGSKAAYFKYGCNDRFYTVGIELTAGISYDFSYWYVTDGLSGWNTLQSAVYSAQTTDSLIQIIHTLNGPTNNTYQRSFGSFTPTVDGVYYFGVYCQATGGPWYLTLDDFKVDVSPSCLGPVNASAQNITPTTADVVFSAGDPTTYNYTIYWKEASATTWNQDDIFGDTTYALINLTPNTVYNVKIAAECSDLTFSEATEFNFRTACSPFDVLPFTENFDSYTAGSTFFPPCWNRLSTYSTQPYVTTTNYSAPNSLYAPVSSGYYAYLIAPEPDPTIIINQLQVKFYAKGAAGESIQVGIMENISNSASFVPIQTIPVTASWAEYTAYLTNYSGSGNRIAFKMAPSVYVSYYIDNVEISSAPTCLPVNDLTVSSVSGSSAYVTWTPNGTPDYFTVEISETGTGIWNTFTSTDPNYILTGLTELTPYTVRISPSCSGFDGLSDSVNFVTTCNVGGDIIIGTPNATTSTNGQYLLFYDLYDYAYTQQIFDATELANVDSIFSISFQYFKTTPLTRNIEIYLGHTLQTTYTGVTNFIPSTSFQQVFQGSVTFSNSGPNNWFTISFPSGFEYHSDSNLVVTFRNMTGIWETSDEKFRTHATTGTKAIYFYQDDTPISISSPSAVYSGTSTFRNNIKFSLPCLPATCIQPNVILSSIGIYNADMIIVPGASETSWEAEYKKITDTTWTTLGTVSSTTYSLPGLSSNTTYQVRFRTVCSATDISAWKTISFTTECGPIIQVPFVENFDTYGQGSNVFPTCWVRHTTAGAYPYITTTPYNGPYSLYFYSSSTTYSMIVLPPLDPSLMLNTLQLTLFGRTGTAGNNLKVGVMTDPSDPSTFSLIGTLTPNSLNTYEELFISFANYTDTGRYVAIKSDNIDLALTNSMYIDSLKLDLLPSCVKPINIVFSAITTTTATASWDPSPTAISYEVVYGLPGVDPATEIPIAVNDTFFEMTPLTATTLYHFYVRSVCAGGEFSEWTFLRTFRTACDAITTLPWTDFFDSYTTGYPNFPQCWTRNTNITGYPYISTSPMVSSPGAMYFYAGSVGNYNIAATPMFDATIPINTLKANFKYRTTSLTDTIYVGVMTDPLNAATFVQVAAIGASATSTWYDKEVIFNTYTGAGQYIAFRVAYNTQYAYGYLDNLEIMDIPTCPRPSLLSATAPTTTSFNLAWTETGTATSWQIEYGVTGFTNGTGTIVSSSNNSIVISPLLPSTTYDFYVRSICGVGDTSYWSLKTIGTTLCVPTTLPFSENFTASFIPACWTQTYSGALTSNRWSIGILNEAGGTGNEMVCTWQNAIGISRLITPGIDFGTNTSATLSFKHFYSDFNPGVTLKIQSSTDLTTWTDQPYSIIGGTGDVGPETATLTLTIPTGVNYIAFVVDGNHFSIDYWYIDDVTITSSTPVCAIPTNLAVNGVTSSTGTATWTAGGSETQWEIAYKPTASATWMTAFVSPVATYNLPSLLAATAYDVKVRAICGAGDTSAYTAIVNFTTLATSCPAPTNLAATAITTTGATITWTPGGSETSWELDYKLASASTWTTVNVSAPSHVLNTLVASTNYNVRVRAVCGSSNLSDYTAIVNFTTATPPCDIPTNVLVPTATITDQSAVVTWTAAAGQTQWQVEYKLVSSANWTTMAVSTSTTQPIQALQSNSTYEVRVKAICSATNESAFTTPVQFTTTGAVTYTITATATGPGTISPAGTVIVTAGADQTFTFTPTGTAQVVALLVDNQSTPYTNNEYTFPNVLANHTIAVDFAEGIDENSIANMVQLYPNPTNATIEIRLDETQLQVKECRVYDIYGKLINIVPVHTDITKIDVNHLAAGVYFVRMNSERGTISKKFVKK